MLVGVLPAILLAWAFYAFNLFALGPVLVLFFINLMIMGWAVALGVVSLILRHGAGAEALAWSVLFGLTPFSAVFYPVSVLPGLMQPIALALPSAHVFEGMRAALLNGVVRWDHLAAAFALNVVWLAGAALLFARQFRAGRGCSGCADAASANDSDAMTTTNRFWLIRHALVEENARAILYGVMDVPLCETTLLEQAPMYQALAARLPRPAVWLVTPLSRTRRTAEAIFAAGYPRSEPQVEPDLIEQSLGEWQGLPHAELPARLTLPKHAFWPLAGR